MTTPLIAFSHVTKKYGAFSANDDLSFNVARGSVHAIIGENGAGKTTAMKMLFGLETPTSGDILFNGVPRTWKTPRGAMQNRLGMVHQHFMLSPVHSALDNVILGREITSSSALMRLFAPVDRKRLLGELEALAVKVGFNIPWHHPVASLAVGTQQQLEIIKLLHAGVDVMIFDEPTAVLSPDETLKFLDVLKGLNSQGKTIIVITHKLKEVKAVADVITVLRRGKSVATKNCADVTVQDMADLMVGRHVALGEVPRPESKPGDTLLALKKVTQPLPGQKNRLTDVSLEVRKGQVVGIAGVEGSGQAELLRFIQNPAGFYKDNPDAKGEISMFGEDAKSWPSHTFRQKSVGIVPADRLREAVLPDETLLENDLLGHDQEFAAGPMTCHQWIDRGLARKRLISVLKTFDVRPQNTDARLGGLSGGNQQKFVMARELSRNPAFIICAQPTRGVDVGSIEQIHTEILRRRTAGAGVLLVSSQLEELTALSDIIHVMFEGAIVATFKRGDFVESRIGMAMGGGTK